MQFVHSGLSSLGCIPLRAPLIGSSNPIAMRARRRRGLPAAAVATATCCRRRLTFAASPDLLKAVLVDKVARSAPISHPRSRAPASSWSRVGRFDRHSPLCCVGPGRAPRVRPRPRGDAGARDTISGCPVRGPGGPPLPRLCRLVLPCPRRRRPTCARTPRTPAGKTAAPSREIGMKSAASAGPIADLRGTTTPHGPTLADWPCSPRAGVSGRCLTPA